MPTFKKTHEEMRSSVCGVCWMKPKKLQLITTKTVIQIKDFVYPLYSVDDDENSWFPKVICDSCRKSLRVKVCTNYLNLFEYDTSQS